MTAESVHASFVEMEKVLLFLQAKGKTGQTFEEIVSGTSLPAHKVQEAITHYSEGTPPKIIRSCQFFRYNMKSFRKIP